MQQSLDKELQELNKEECMYSAVIKEAQAHTFGVTRDALSELEATTSAHEEGLRALEEQLEVGHDKEPAYAHVVCLPHRCVFPLLLRRRRKLSQAEAAGLQAELNELNQQETALEEAERHFWSRLSQHELKAQEDDDEVSHAMLFGILTCLRWNRCLALPCLPLSARPR